MNPFINVKGWMSICYLKCSKESLRKIMSASGMQSRVKRKFVTTTDSAHKQPVVPNLLNRNFDADAPNQKWVADIT